MQNDPKPQPLTAPKANSKLIKLEREIAGVSDRIRSGMDRAQARLKKRRTIAALIGKIKRKSASLITLSMKCGLATIKSARKLIHVSIHSGSRPSTRKSTVLPPTETLVRKGPTSHRANTLEYLFISACLGLIGISGILISVLFLQIRDMKAKMEKSEIELATTREKLNRLEKLALQSLVKEPTPTKTVQAIRPPLSLSEADGRVIREIIKVLPPKPGAVQKIHSGDEITGLALAPLPESLIAQIPKLHGARFSIDEDGAIVIVGEGSDRVDAVLSNH